MRAAAHNIAGILRRSAAVFPDLPAIAVGTKTVRTYRELAERVERMAAHLVSMNEPGARIVVNSPNRAEYLELLFAIWQAGMIAVPVNCKLHPSEVDFIYTNCGATRQFGIGGVQMGGSVYEAMATSQDRLMVPYAVEPDSPAWIFYTSGTTGRPKGATLTHGNLLAMCHAFLVDVVPVEPGDAMVHSCQLSHGSGLYALPHVLKAGCNVVLEHSGFDAEEAARLMHSWGLRGQSTFGPPTVLNRIVHAWEMSCHDDYHPPKALIFGGSPLYVEDLNRAYRVMDGRIAQIYGQGETPCTITALSPAMYEKAFQRDQSDPIGDARMRASVGVPQTGIEIRIADQDDNELPAGEIGEVLVRGPTVMQGYWNNPAATAKTLRNGWLHTGDVGFVDKDGFLTLKDRSKDVIISGGFNVYPREVEEVLLKHPNVLEVSVVGRASAKWGEEIIAYVVLREADLPLAEWARRTLDDELTALCVSNIARFKRPREYFFVPELPKSAYGKVLKTVLREVEHA